jgi:hypothetical protein
MDTLIDQAGLADPSLTDHGHHLTVACPSTLQGLDQGRELRVASDKAGEPRTAAACKRRRIPLAPTSSKMSTGLLSPFTGMDPRGMTCTNPSTSRRVAAVKRMVPGVASCSSRAARCVVWPTAE